MAKDIYFSQGIYPLKNPIKYKGSLPVTYRSAPEFKIMRWLDIKDNIIEWSSESIIIPYVKPTDGQVHRYFVDFCCKLKEKNGNVTTYLIEYKPYKKTIAPTISKRKSQKTQLYESMEYAINQSKWDSARQYAKSHGMMFIILTEKEIN